MFEAPLFKVTSFRKYLSTSYIYQLYKYPPNSYYPPPESTYQLYILINYSPHNEDGYSPEAISLFKLLSLPAHLPYK
jgi:hypothetical protein